MLGLSPRWWVRIPAPGKVWSHLVVESVEAADALDRLSGLGAQGSQVAGVAVAPEECADVEAVRRWSEPPTRPSMSVTVQDDLVFVAADPARSDRVAAALEEAAAAIGAPICPTRSPLSLPWPL